MQLLQDISRTKAPNVMRFGNTLQEFLTSLDSETEVVLQVGVGQVARLSTTGGWVSCTHHRVEAELQIACRVEVEGGGGPPWIAFSYRPQIELFSVCEIIHACLF